MPQSEPVDQVVRRRRQYLKSFPPGTDFRQARFAGHVHCQAHSVEASELVASLFQPGSRQRVVADEEQRLQAWGVDGAPLNLAWRKACRANWKRT